MSNTLAPALRLLLVLVSAARLQAEPGLVGPVPEAVRDSLRLEVFYQKHTSVAGFSIVGSTNVSDHALREAAWILERMMAGREDF